MLSQTGERNDPGASKHRKLQLDLFSLCLGTSKKKTETMSEKRGIPCVIRITIDLYKHQLGKTVWIK